MISQYFISRPIFAGVLSALIFLAGALAVFQLPITEYPEVVPPTVVVSASYPGANPVVIAETVAASGNKVYLSADTLLLNLMGNSADDKFEKSMGRK